VCDQETSRMGARSLSLSLSLSLYIYIYDISHLRVKYIISYHIFSSYLYLNRQLYGFLSPSGTKPRFQPWFSCNCDRILLWRHTLKSVVIHASLSEFQFIWM